MEAHFFQRVESRKDPINHYDEKPSRNIDLVSQTNDLISND